jgi:hypothetical protein
MDQGTEIVKVTSLASSSMLKAVRYVVERESRRSSSSAKVLESNESDRDEIVRVFKNSQQVANHIHIGIKLYLF